MDKQGVRRFLEAINYLSKFCPQLSTVTQPLPNLTKDDIPFLWAAKHQQAFDEAKALATSSPCLAYYDVNAPVILQVDASDYGLEAALLQPSKQHSSSTLEDSYLQSVAYSSKNLTPTEQRYAQIEKEYLAIVEAFNKFDQWLLGKSDITVHTDHQPLQSIFQKDLSSATKRLQKMMLFLRDTTSLSYTGKGLRYTSRIPCPEHHTEMRPPLPPCLQLFKCSEYISLTWTPHRQPSQKALANNCATAARQDMQLLAHYVTHGWPPTKEHLPQQLQAFWHF